MEHRASFYLSHHQSLATIGMANIQAFTAQIIICAGLTTACNLFQCPSLSVALCLPSFRPCSPASQLSGLTVYHTSGNTPFQHGQRCSVTRGIKISRHSQ